MSEICGAEHPDHPEVRCDVRVDQHKRFHTNRERGLAWPDPSYPIPTPRTSSGRKKGTKAVLADFLRGGSAEGAILADEGIERAAGAASPEWKAEARACLRRAAQRQRLLTSEDANDLMSGENSVEDRRAWGSIMRWGAQQRLIRKTETFVTSRYGRRHVGPVQQWESLIYQESES